MPRIYNVHMTMRQQHLVVSMIQLLVNRLELDDPIITYKELAEEIGTSYRKLGQPLLLMAQVIHQCPVHPNIPSLNALVVYSYSHLPARDGLINAEQGVNIENDEQLLRLSNQMNEHARAFGEWESVIESINENSFD